MLRYLVLLVLSASLTACGKSDYSNSYVYGDDTVVLQLSIVEAEQGAITGNVSVAELDYEAGKLKVTTRPISGVRKGERFSLRAEGKSIGDTTNALSIEAKDGSLFLNLPQNGQAVEMKPMDQDGYRERLAKLEANLTANDVGLVTEE